MTTTTQRGFERFYGMLHGAGSYFDPPTLMDQDSIVMPEDLQLDYSRPHDGAAKE